jgi:hypothetical protein
MSAATNVFGVAFDYNTDASVFGVVHVFTGGTGPVARASTIHTLRGTSRRIVTARGQSQAVTSIQGTSREVQRLRG